MPGLRGFRGAALALLTLCGTANTAPLPVHVGGRVIANGDGSLSFGWPAAYFEGRFRGTGVTVAVETSTEWLKLWIDGVQKAVLMQPGLATATIAGLAPGDHVVRLEKLTESQSGGGRFIGFTPIEGGSALPAPVRARQIEFIGDSYSVGYGNLSPIRVCTEQEVHDRTDSQQAFGPLTARRLEADYRVNAYSGFGIVRNYNGVAPGLSLPAIYARARPDDEAGRLRVREDGTWRPQVIVINLGTNDFSTPVHAGEKWADDRALRTDYRRSYEAFARRILAEQPQAHLVLMGSDDFYGEVERVAAALNAHDAGRVVTLRFGGMERTGCNWHPSLKDHAAQADSLSAFLMQHAEFWVRP